MKTSRQSLVLLAEIDWSEGMVQVRQAPNTLHTDRPPLVHDIANAQPSLDQLIFNTGPGDGGVKKTLK